MRERKRERRIIRRRIKTEGIVLHVSLKVMVRVMSTLATSTTDSPSPHSGGRMAIHVLLISHNNTVTRIPVIQYKYT